MTIDQRFKELVNAELDGEIAADERALLDEYLAGDDEARAYRDDLHALRDDLDTIVSVAPPESLRQSILDSIRPPRRTADGSAAGFWRVMSDFIALPPVRYAMSFAAGVIVTLTLVSSEQASRHAFDDVTGLVGTMAGSELTEAMSAGDGMQLTLNEIAGSVSLNRAGSLLILDFDLATRDAVEIVATFDDRDIWFNGFAQLESTGTSVAAETGRVTVRMSGQRRYAVYLHITGRDAARVNLRFYSSGELLHEGDLRYGATD